MQVLTYPGNTHSVDRFSIVVADPYSYKTAFNNSVKEGQVDKSERKKRTKNKSLVY